MKVNEGKKKIKKIGEKCCSLSSVEEPVAIGFVFLCDCAIHEPKRNRRTKSMVKSSHFIPSNPAASSAKISFDVPAFQTLELRE